RAASGSRYLRQGHTPGRSVFSLMLLIVADPGERVLEKWELLPDPDGGGAADQCPPLVGQVRLVAVAAVGRDRGEGVAAARADRGDGPFEPHQTRRLLRRDTDLPGEPLRQVASAPADLCGDVGDRPGAAGGQ